MSLRQDIMETDTDDLLDGNNRRLLFNSDRSGLISGIFNLDGYAGEYFSTRSTIPPYLYGQYDICSQL